MKEILYEAFSFIDIGRKIVNFFKSNDRVKDSAEELVLNELAMMLNNALGEIHNAFLEYSEKEQHSFLKMPYIENFLKNVKELLNLYKNKEFSKDPSQEFLSNVNNLFYDLSNISEETTLVELEKIIVQIMKKLMEMSGIKPEDANVDEEVSAIHKFFNLFQLYPTKNFQKLLNVEKDILTKLNLQDADEDFTIPQKYVQKYKIEQSKEVDKEFEKEFETKFTKQYDNADEEEQDELYSKRSELKFKYSLNRWRDIFNNIWDKYLKKEWLEWHKKNVEKNRQKFSHVKEDNSEIVSLRSQLKSILNERSIESEKDSIISFFNKHFKNSGELVWDVWGENLSLEKIIQMLTSIDPLAEQTNGKKIEFEKIILNWVGHGKKLLEDSENMHNVLKKYKALQNKNITLPMKAIAYDSPGQLEDAIEKALPKNNIENNTEYPGKIVAIFGDFILRRIDNWEEGSKCFTDSGWCVQQKQYFDDYSPPYYMVTEKKGTKEKRFALIHVNSKQIKDVRDDPLSIEDIQKIKPFVEKLFDLDELIKNYNKEEFGNDIDQFIAIKLKYGNNIPEHIIDAISKDSYYAVEFADKILHFKDIPEKIMNSILSSSRDSFLYAKKIGFKDVPEKIIDAISRVGQYSASYAISLIRMTDSVPEKIIDKISTNAISSSWYAASLTKNNKIIPEKIINSIASNETASRSYIIDSDIRNIPRKIPEKIIDKLSGSYASSYWLASEILDWKNVPHKIIKRLNDDGSNVMKAVIKKNYGDIENMKEEIRQQIKQIFEE